MEYNVYMIDDNWQKQKLFFLILNKANEISEKKELDVVFRSGFGDGYREAADKSKDGTEVFTALQDPNGVYLVDMILKETDENLAQLYKLLPIETISELNDIINKRNTLSLVADEFKFCFGILIYCKQNNKPSMSVSTESSNWAHTEVLKSRIVKDFEGFPGADPELYPLSDVILASCANRIIALLDLLDKRPSDCRGV